MIMSRNYRGRDRDNRRNFGAHDGLLGEAPGGGGGGSNIFDPLMSTQVNQLMLAQQLLQKQAALSAGLGVGGGGDFSALAGAMNMQMMQQQQLQQAMGGFGGGMHSSGTNDHHHRKRIGAHQDRDMDGKRRRRDSFGRSGDHDRDRNRGGDGRDRARSSRWETVEERKKDKKPEKSGDDYDPAEPTEDNDEETKDSNRYCHVCNVSVYDDASFRRHLNGTKHQARMNSVLTVHQMKSTQLQSRLKAEEHLRKIEGKAGGFDPDYFCKICNNELTIPWERHRFSNIHKQRQLQVKRGCGWCGVHDFNNFTEVLEHRETEEHKKNADMYGKKKDEPASKDKKKEDKQRSGSSADKKVRPKKKEEEEDLTIPEFDAEKPVGLKYIVPVTGYFCKLCHKFYNNEKSAKGTHCQSEAHYEKFKAAIEAKQAARAKRLEEEAAAAAEAEAKASEAEDEMMLEDDKQTDNGMLEQTKEDDFDDALPLEDSDDEGGLVKLIAADNGEDREMDMITGPEDSSILEETSANASFTFLSGEQAEQHIEDMKIDAGASGDATETTDVVDLDKGQTGDVETLDLSISAPEQLKEVDAVGEECVEELDDDIVADLSGLSQGDVDTTAVTIPEEQVVTPTEAKPARAKARRGRGRGRGKK